jgi:hypothetical protein
MTSHHDSPASTIILMRWVLKLLRNFHMGLDGRLQMMRRYLREESD